ncbi:uncharacterized protein KY384_001062 [Bacidia gigantensis]|uniref:uncharacterized protein n=1 Tax=Bacidia gigantensis TaxID=2732470 RepID=UPI001D055BB6|nr:uncharacterized protein KY384_001062 [Bacidia gigantensis]KAG8534218.1 hypothetical protein KY384_001062 [Bacidia gigantensis]
MSVFGHCPATQSSDLPQSPSRIPNTDLKANSLGFQSSIRRDSTSTFESTETSPTTTISTVESSLTEPSPGSSPESPGSVHTRSSFQSPKTSLHLSPRTMEGKGRFSNSFPSLPGIDQSESPHKKVRNMKNLSVNTLASNRPATSNLPKLGMVGASTSQPSHAFSAPPTPAFIVPPKAPRRKPSKLGLTLETPDPGSSHAQDRPAIVPQTPSDSQIQTLRRLQASTDGSLLSPTVAPEGGMRLPPFTQTSSSQFTKVGLPLSSSPNPLSSPIKKQTLEHVKEEPDYEVPLSQEAKSPAYPQGPVCIYDPYLYLYLEPTGVEAREFDVILNVAREVRNPFEKEREAVPERRTADKGVQTNFDRVDKGVQASFDAAGGDLAGQDDVPEPLTATTEFSFRSAVELQQDDVCKTAPSTPKASRPEPEYIHIPWDHNANVVDDLLRLCDLVEDRIRQKKKILVHCQCGVSRSASLVVAYGIYKNPQLTVQEAYDAVKNRSRWIGPNMNLIYQLSEFKGKLTKAQVGNWQSWGAPTSGGSGLQQPRPEDSRMAMSAIEPHPPSNPITGGSRLSRFAPTASHDSPDSNSRASKPQLRSVSPGPSSAPLNYGLASSKAPSPPQIKTGLDIKPILSPLETNTLPLGTILSPTVQTTDNAPVGAVASDLREVAKGLQPTLQSPMTGFAGHIVKGQVDETVAPPGSWPNDAETPKIAAKPSISDLALGFSSLFGRRQGPQALSLGPQLSRPSHPPIAPQSFKSVLRDDVPPTPSLLSPRAAEFTASPFHRTVAGDLAGSSVFEQGLMSPRSVDEDPRSPPLKGEAPITRNIFDVL